MSQSTRVQRHMVITIELSDQDYEQLVKKAKEAGFSDVTQYVESLLRSSPPTQLASIDIDERVQKRLERVIQDILNPFTQKVDDMAKRLAAIEEAVEELRSQPPQLRTQAPSERPQAPARTAAVAEREQPQGSKAIERLRRQGAVFEEEVSWLRAPDRFFARLEKEGAMVLELSNGKAAVDPEFWKRFLAELESTSLRDSRQVADKLSAVLGDRASQLFSALAKSGLVVYDEDEKKWKVRLPQRQQARGQEEEGEGEEEL